MRDIQWLEVRRFLEKEIKYCTERCINVDTEERERLINAAELRAFERVLTLQRLDKIE